ncbi:MAG: glycosyltransferase family 4 protein [Anaerolineales bacterium]|nr:glycosyltransferase family 4 protein [Anaerolineales bacterium]
MRIGLLTDCYRPGVNGIVHFLALHQRVLREWGHEPFVFTWGPPHPDDEPGVVRSWGAPFPRPGYHLGGRYSRRAEALLATMDVLHAQQPAMSGVLAARYGRRYGIPVVLTCHSRYDMLWATALPLLSERQAVALLRRPMRWITERCDLIVAPSESAAAVVRRLGVTQPIEIVPCGVDLAGASSTSAPAPGDLGWLRDGPLAFYLGRLSAEKDVSLLLEALAQPALAGAHLLVGGDGSERVRLEERATVLGLIDRAHFVGEVSQEQALAYARLAALFVTASQIEMLPISVLQALGAGLPVVAIDTPWARNVIEPGVNGLLTAPDAAAFAEAWACLVRDGVLRARLSTGALEFSRQYDVQHTTALLLERYRRLTQRR